MYTTYRFWFKYGNEEDEVMITEKEWETLEKAKAYCHRYAKGPKFASVEIQDESGNVIYELFADGSEEENPFEPQLPAEENKQAVELTPLERIIFRERDTCLERYSLFLEKAENSENEEEFDYYRFNALVANRIADYLVYIIMEVGLTEKWYSWQERREQEAVGASK